MIVSISQPRYLPWLGYIERLAQCDLFIHLDTVQYSPRDWENRNRIKTAQGTTWLTVPVKAGHRARIPDVLIDNEQGWQYRHWETLKTAYGRAPFFKTYASAFEAIYCERAWDTLTEWNLAALETVCGCLGISPQTTMASTLEPGGAGSELILNLCRQVGATVYLSGSQGRNYLDQTAFAAANIEIQYQDYVHPVHPQVHGAFVPNLAVVDLLFNCGPRSLKMLRTSGGVLHAA